MANIVELRETTDEQIEEMLEDSHEELFNLRFQTATAQLEDYSRIRAVRRELAQLKEVLHKRRLATQIAARHPEIASTLAGKEWSAEVHFDYEQSIWLVEFADDDDNELATVGVNLNLIKRASRRARRTRKAQERVVSYEVAG